MNQIVSIVLKAVLVTLVSSIAAIAVEKIRSYNQDRSEVTLKAEVVLLKSNVYGGDLPRSRLRCRIA